MERDYSVEFSKVWNMLTELNERVRLLEQIVSRYLFDCFEGSFFLLIWILLFFCFSQNSSQPTEIADDLVYKPLCISTVYDSCINNLYEDAVKTLDNDLEQLELETSQAVGEQPVQPMDFVEDSQPVVRRSNRLATRSISGSQSSIISKESMAIKRSTGGNMMVGNVSNKKSFGLRKSSNLQQSLLKPKDNSEVSTGKTNLVKQTIEEKSETNQENSTFPSRLSSKIRNSYSRLFGVSDLKKKNTADSLEQMDQEFSVSNGPKGEKIRKCEVADGKATPDVTLRNVKPFSSAEKHKSSPPPRPPLPVQSSTETMSFALRRNLWERRSLGSRYKFSEAK